MLRILFSFTLFAIWFNSFSQISIDSVSSDAENNEYILKVKSIDDLIDRFNGIDSGYLKEHLLKLDPSYKTSRKNLLVSIVDAEYRKKNYAICQEFINQFDDTMAQHELDLYKSNIYAKISGSYNLNGETIELDHILKIKTNSLGSKKAQWLISYIPLSQLVKLKDDITSVYLPPGNHNQKFNKLQDFITSSTISEVILLDGDNGLPVFFSLVNRGDLVLTSLNNQDVQYFIYIDNWLITVSEYRREGLQSGYLIDGLQKVVPQDAKEPGLMTLIFSEKAK